MSIGRGEATMENGDMPEPSSKSSHGLWRQRDFRNQHDRPLPRGDNLPNALQINLGLAAAGDSKEQVDGESLIESRAKCVENLRLILVECEIDFRSRGGSQIRSK